MYWAFRGRHFAIIVIIIIVINTNLYILVLQNGANDYCLQHWVLRAWSSCLPVSLAVRLFLVKFALLLDLVLAA